MVDLAAAGGVIEDTILVISEDSLACVKSHSEDTLLECSLMLGNISTCDLAVIQNFDYTVFRFVNVASSSLGHIGVLALEHLWISLKIFESTGVPSTVATMRPTVARDKLLL